MANKKTYFIPASSEPEPMWELELPKEMLLQVEKPKVIDPSAPVFQSKHPLNPVRLDVPEMIVIDESIETIGAKEREELHKYLADKWLTDFAPKTQGIIIEKPSLFESAHNEFLGG